MKRLRWTEWLLTNSRSVRWACEGARRAVRLSRCMLRSGDATAFYWRKSAGDYIRAGRKAQKALLRQLQSLVLNGGAW